MTSTVAGAPEAAGAQGRDRARVVDEVAVGERLVDLTVASPALGGEAVKVRLLTPDGWGERGPGDRWPVLYLLHGASDTYEAWTEPWSEGGITSWPEVRDTLVVMPSGGAVGWYSDWWNGGAGGAPAWEEFHLDELRHLLEGDYGAGRRRAVAGLSMGGFGAVSYAARRPGMFRAAASFSGPVHILLPGFGAVLDQQGEAYGIDMGRVWGDPVEQRDVWEAHDPYHLARRLRGVPVHLSSGDGDPGPLDPPGSVFDPWEALLIGWNREAATRFAQAGVDVTTRFYGDGNHHPAYAERELRHAWPLLRDALHPAR